MDSGTLFDHGDLWGIDPEPHVGALQLLTPGGRATLQSLSAEGNVRGATTERSQPPRFCHEPNRIDLIETAHRFPRTRGFMQFQ